MTVSSGPKIGLLIVAYIATYVRTYVQHKRVIILASSTLATFLVLGWGKGCWLPQDRKRHYFWCSRYTVNIKARMAIIIVHDEHTGYHKPQPLYFTNKNSFLR